MKKFLYFLVLCFMLSNSTSIIGQSNTALAVVEVPDTDKVSSKKPKKKKSRIPYYYRHHRQLPSTFSGYTIELTTSKIPLKRDNKLFKYFGKVYYTKLKKGGFAYSIIVNFSTKDAVSNFLENVVKHKAPKAKIVTYKKGKKR